jgi:glycosyltransferase involved in cell wall biosynthesis
MQQGKPVVCAAVGGNSEIIDDGETGYLYPMGDVDLLTKHLQELCKSVAQREKVGQSGQKKVASLYTVSDMRKKHEDIYHALLR